MRKQKTLNVDGEKIKIISSVVAGGFGVNTIINGSRYHHNFEIMKDFEIKSDNHKEVFKEFLKRAEERAYVKWVKEYGKCA